MQDDRSKSILVVDDEPNVCELVREGLADMGYDCQAVSDPRAASEMIDKSVIDLLISDIAMPGMTGLEAIKLLHKSFPSIRVIVLTTYEGDEDIHQALEAGAASYIIKGMKHDRLLQGIRRVHSGKSYLPPEVSKVVDERPHDELSAREREVLMLMAEGMSNRDIAGELGIAEKTVKCHVGVILNSFGVKGRTNAVLMAIRRGYVKV